MQGPEKLSIPTRNAILALALAAAVALPSPLMAWPPWLSIETPVNPSDPVTRGAFLLVHTYTRPGSNEPMVLTGTAEGLVRGKRESVRLSFDSTPRSGVFALRKQWPSTIGTWMLVITVLPHTTAIVDLARTGEVAAVRIPLQRIGRSDVPRAVTRQEIDSSLVARASVQVASDAQKR
jgi:hypothetical protein